MKKHSLYVVLITIFSLSACTSQQVNLPSGDPAIAVTAQPDATRVARDILAAGGSAADAAVAAAFALTVVEPTMNGIGGRNQILVRNAGGSFAAYNGMTEIPANYVRPDVPVSSGYGTIATPGALAALARLHREQGVLPWNTVVMPAVLLARDGFIMLPGEAARQLSALPSIADNPGFKRSFVKSNGTTYKAGELIRQPDLAATLGKIAAEGSDVFYQGDIAAQIAADMQANGGHVTRLDLANYTVPDGRLVTTRYRGYDIQTIAAPAGGGLVVKALNILEQFPLSSYNNLVWAAVVNQALALSIKSMEADYDEQDLEALASKAWAREQAKKIRVPRIRFAAAESLNPRAELAGIGHDWSGDSWGADAHHTTHFVTADCTGQVVSITQTLGPNFGSKVITPGLGFVYASTMGTYLSTAAQAPGSRPRTTIAPTILIKDGKVELVLGAAGGLRILSAIVQTISRYVDQKMSLEAAVAAPRVHPKVRTDSATQTREVMMDSFHAETTPGTGWSDVELERWQAAGIDPQPNPRVGAFGRVHAAKLQAGDWLGVADPDWEGTSLGLTPVKCNQAQ